MKRASLLLRLAGICALTAGVCFATEPPDQISGQGVADIHKEKEPSGGHKPDAEAHGKTGEADKALSSDSSGGEEKDGEEGPITRPIPSVLSGRVHVEAKPASHSPFSSPKGTLESSAAFRATVITVSQTGFKKAVTQEAVNKFGEELEPLVAAPLASKATEPAPHFVPSRVASPVFLGGLTAASAKSSTAAINGTGMKRRSY